MKTSGPGADSNNLEIDFDLSAVQALVITNAHIDHVGHFPYLLATGFTGATYCSKPSAVLLPLAINAKAAPLFLSPLLACVLAVVL